MSTILLEQIETDIPTTGKEPDPRYELQPPETTPEPNEAEFVEHSQVEIVPFTANIVPTPPALPAPKKRGRPPKAKAEAQPPPPRVMKAAKSQRP